MQVALTRAWWVLVVRGIFGIALGIASFSMPFTTMQALLILFGVYAIFDGIFALVAAIRAAERHMRWWPFLVEGIIGVAAGGAAVVLPGVTALVLVSVAGGWAILTGILEVIAAVRLRREIKNEWVLAFAGLVSILFGVAILLFPVAGAVWFVFLIGMYALVFGVLYIVLGFKIRGHEAVAMGTGL